MFSSKVFSLSINQLPQEPQCCIPEDHKIRPLTDSRSFQPTAAKLFVDILRKCLRIATSPKDQAQSSGSSPGTAMAFRWIDKTDPPWSCSRSAPSHMDCCIHRRLSCTPRTPAFQGISDIIETTPAYRPSPVCSHIPPPDHSAVTGSMMTLFCFAKIILLFQNFMI